MREWGEEKASCRGVLFGDETRPMTMINAAALIEVAAASKWQCEIVKPYKVKSLR
jgi:hypothetical protein